MSLKYSINLLQPELLPEQPLITLKRVVIVWVVSLVVMIALAIWGSAHIDELQKQSNQIKASNAQSSSELTQLREKYQASQSDPVLVNRLALLKQVMLNKKSFYQELNNSERTYVKGFSGAMTELSDLHFNEVTLKQVNITNDHITFSGVARKPNSVPQWLEGFERSSLLSGKSFAKFQLNENESGITEFVVSTEIGSQEQ